MKKKNVMSILYLENGQELEVPDELLQMLFSAQLSRMERNRSLLDLEKEARRLMALVATQEKKRINWEQR
jgi:flagellin-specific chaperone FliS